MSGRRMYRALCLLAAIVCALCALWSPAGIVALVSVGVMWAMTEATA